MESGLVREDYEVESHCKSWENAPWLPLRDTSKEVLLPRYQASESRSEQCLPWRVCVCWAWGRMLH